MKKTFKLFTFLLLVFAVGFTACNNSAESKKKGESQTISEKEASAWDLVQVESQLLKTDIYDDTINGVHVIFKYMGDDKYFFGSRENVTEELIEGFQIGVHLSNGIDLGPTPAGDLKPGKQGTMMIDADIKEWEKWAVNVEFVKADL